MMRRIADSIMAGFRFQPIAGFGVSEGDGKEEEREGNAKDVGHTLLLLLEVAGKSQAPPWLSLSGLKKLGEDVSGDVTAESGDRQCAENDFSRTIRATMMQGMTQPFSLSRKADPVREL